MKKNTWRMHQSNLLRELCDKHNITATALRHRVLRTRQHYSNWELIKRFCRQELTDVEGVHGLFQEYYNAWINMAKIK